MSLFYFSSTLCKTPVTHYQSKKACDGGEGLEDATTPPELSYSAFPTNPSNHSAKFYEDLSFFSYLRSRQVCDHCLRQTVSIG